MNITFITKAAAVTPGGISNSGLKFRKRDDGDGRVDVFGGGCGVKKIVTIDTTVTGSCPQTAGAKPRPP